MLLPLQGVSAIDRAGQPFDDPEARQALFAALRERRILVRHFKQLRIDNHLRITVGTQAECEALVDALRHILSATPSAGASLLAPIGTP